METLRMIDFILSVFYVITFIIRVLALFVIAIFV